MRTFRILCSGTIGGLLTASYVFGYSGVCPLYMNPEAFYLGNDYIAVCIVVIAVAFAIAFCDLLVMLLSSCCHSRALVRIAMTVDIVAVLASLALAIQLTWGVYSVCNFLPFCSDATWPQSTVINAMVRRSALHLHTRRIRWRGHPGHGERFPLIGRLQGLSWVLLTFSLLKMAQNFAMLRAAASVRTPSAGAADRACSIRSA